MTHDAVTAPSTDPAYEPFVLTLEWFCVSCGWRIVIDAPGFAGDGVYHYPAPDAAPGGGPFRCGPLLARRTGHRRRRSCRHSRQPGRKGTSMSEPLTAGEPPEKARHRGESRNPQGVLDGNAPPAPAVSVFAEPLAQVKQAMDDALVVFEDSQWARAYRNDLPRALDLIEQRATDMEKALRQALDCKGSYNGTVSERGGEPAICTKCEEAVRAVLSACEEAPDQDDQWGRS